MIYRVDSSLPSFKTLEFGPGLNVLVAKKEAGATDRQTRNRAGKSSLLEIVHFLAGADNKKDSIFRLRALEQATFGMEFDLGGERVRVERGGAAKGKVRVAGASFLNGRTGLSNTEWVGVLGREMFGLEEVSIAGQRRPTFRSLFAYFVRRQLSQAFVTPEKQAGMQQTGDWQLALMFMLGLEWQIASDWQRVRDREKTLKELKKAAGAGAFGSFVGRASELRTQLAVHEAQLVDLTRQLAAFQVLPQYAELQAEADRLVRALKRLGDADLIDLAAIGDLQRAMESEAPPAPTDLERLYEEAGVVLPGAVVRRYEEVQSFHESIIRNRRDYLAEELAAANQRVARRAEEGARIEARLAQVMGILEGHGALEQFSLLQSEAARMGASVESLRQRFEAAEQLEGTKNELGLERNRLALRLRRDFAERKELLDEAILAFERTSKRLYESAGSMNVEETSNGPVFHFPMQGERSKGIKNMQIFCFDMMLMRLCSQRDMGPGFLIHDSHLFDGVDGRQVISALKLGAEMATELGFQYIVTMNEDDAFKETIPRFDVRDYVLPTVLTDATEDGGLFGIRF